ncbi:MAG: glycosyltransferase family 4 protein [Candidatus Pacebacteria bacterium]|nr:glycosyltransferase family 4 protein [Candidatus Paceibacterota bacterium]
MKVLMIGWELPPFNSGGLGVACFYLAKELSKKIDLTFSLPFKLPLNSLPFKVIFASERYFKTKGYYEKFMLPVNSELLSLVFSYGERILSVYHEKPSLVHGHDWFSAPATIFLSDYFKVPSLIHVHSTEVERTGNNPNPIIFKIEKEYFNKADFLLAVGEFTKNVLINVYEVPKEKVFVLPNGFDWGDKEKKIPFYIKYLKENEWKIVLFVGRLVLQKGPDYFLHTLPLVKKFIPKVKYVIVGSGDMFLDLVRIAKNYHVEENVLFTNFLRDKDLWGIYSLADLLVVPSVADPFGLVPLEGINFYLPVIVSYQTGVGYYLSHMMKFNFWDIKEMANKIVGILKYESLKKEYTKNLFYEAKTKFDWKKSAEELLSFYSKILIR